MYVQNEFNYSTFNDKCACAYKVSHTVDLANSLREVINWVQLVVTRKYFVLPFWILFEEYVENIWWNA
jgi:hypothetical protein